MARALPVNLSLYCIEFGHRPIKVFMGDCFFSELPVLLHPALAFVVPVGLYDGGLIGKEFWNFLQEPSAEYHCHQRETLYTQRDVIYRWSRRSQQPSWNVERIFIYQDVRHLNELKVEDLFNDLQEYGLKGPFFDRGELPWLLTTEPAGVKRAGCG